MEFERKRAQKKLAEAWNAAARPEKTGVHSFEISGPRGSGKTYFAQELVRSQRGFYYMSFAGMTAEEALRKFTRLYLPEGTAVTNWKEAASVFYALRDHYRTLLIFEDEPEELRRECKEAFAPYSRRKGLFHICEITHDDSGGRCSVLLPYLTIADFCDNLSAYSRPDIMRLHALTGGIPAVAKELDPQKSFEENVRQLLRFDSAFSTALPEQLRLFFRAPESYLPLLGSMASGCRRLSEIARDAGFTNKKCGKYLDALTDAGFVTAEKDGGPYARYHSANSYYAAWSRYVWRQQTEQIMRPEEHVRHVLSDLDKSVAVPAFQEACRRFDREAEFYVQDICPDDHRAIPVKLKDGGRVLLDCCDYPAYGSRVCVFPQSLTMRFTKKEMQAVLKAVEKLVSLYSTEITVFSLERFSDWCVHESAKRDYLHEVTMNRLSY